MLDKEKIPALGIAAAAVLLLVAILFLNRGRILGNDTPEPTPEPVELSEVVEDGFQFINHIQAEFPEQDVYIETDETEDGMVVRPEGKLDGDTLALPVFASAEANGHDPFKLGEDPLGPVDKGEELGFTLGDWLPGKATGNYELTEDGATLSIDATGLVPNGVYTVWCSRMVLPPEPSVVDTPCGAADGSDNVVNADDLGDLTYSITMDEPLADSTNEEASVFALAYHSDGETYAEDPGEFGKVTHVQLFYLIPPPETE